VNLGGVFVSGNVTIAHPAGIPEGPFDISSIYFSGTEDVDDAALKELAGFHPRHLRVLQLHHQRFTDKGLEELREIPRLVELDLSSNSITDEGVKTLTALTQLQDLDLSQTQITDKSLGVLAAFSRLTDLKLDQTQITDQGLAHLPQLKSLSLKKTPITDAGLKHLEKQPWLIKLNISFTHVSESAIAELKAALPICEIEGRPLRAATPGPPRKREAKQEPQASNQQQRAEAAKLWEEVPNTDAAKARAEIAKLDLPPKVGSSDREWATWLLDHGTLHCRIFADVDPDTGIIFSKDLPPIPFHIQKLGFEAPRDAGGFGGPIVTLGASDVNPFLLRRLADLPALRELYIDQQVPASALQGLAALKTLEKLSINKSKGGDDGLRATSAVTRLKWLRFNGEKITDAGLRHLASLKELTLLDLSGHARDLRGSGFEALSGLDKLQTLDVSGSGLDDEGARQIGRLTSLERLSLRDTWISGNGLAALINLKQLKVLNLGHCRRLQSEDMVPLGKLSELEQLNISDCRIAADDASLRALIGTLKQLKHLRTLRVDNTLMRGLNGVLPDVRINGVDWDRQPLGEFESSAVR